MKMVCDRCGEAFLLSNDVKYMTPFDDELDQFESNSIVKCLAGDDKGVYSIRDETVVLCPSCMAALNDWLKGEKVSKKVSDILPKTEILGQLAEELAEASAAASKLRRKIDGKNPTPKTLEECWEDLKKEIGDVINAIDALTEQDSQNYHEFMSECGEYAEPKMERWLSRLEAKEQSDE